MSNELRGPVALVLNDMINANLRTKDDPARTETIARTGLVGRVAQCVQKAREAHIPIFWIQVARRADRADVVATLTDLIPRRVSTPKPPVLAGSFAAANVDELPVHADDQVVLKPRMDPFIGTELDILLRSRGIKTILLGGYSTNGGVESATRTGNDLNYDMVVIADCCYNVEEDAHEFALTSVLPFYGRVRQLDDVIGMIDEYAQNGFGSA